MMPSKGVAMAKLQPLIQAHVISDAHSYKEIIFQISVWLVIPLAFNSQINSSGGHYNQTTTICVVDNAFLETCGLHSEILFN